HYAILKRISALQLKKIHALEYFSPPLMNSDIEPGAFMLDSNLLLIQTYSGLDLFDIRNPEEPEKLQNIPGSIYIWRNRIHARVSFMYNGVLYSKAQSSEKFLINLVESNYLPEENINYSNNYDIYGRVAISGDYVFSPFIDSNGGQTILGVFDVELPQSIQLVHEFEIETPMSKIYQVSCNDEWLVGCDGLSIRFFKLSNPLDIQAIKEFNYLSNSYYDTMILYKDYLFFLTGPSTGFNTYPFQELRVFYAPKGQTPVEVFAYTIGKIETSTATGMVGIDNSIYVPGGDAGFYVFRINDESEVGEWALY
ncbi:hypothetical protein K8I31_12140, partial [bacterium]|nr:hypothetical protein [bacterium]